MQIDVSLIRGHSGENINSLEQKGKWTSWRRRKLLGAKGFLIGDCAYPMRKNTATYTTPI